MTFSIINNHKPSIAGHSNFSINDTQGVALKRINLIVGHTLVIKSENMINTWIKSVYIIQGDAIIKQDLPAYLLEKMAEEISANTKCSELIMELNTKDILLALTDSKYKDFFETLERLAENYQKYEPGLTRIAAISAAYRKQHSVPTKFSEAMFSSKGIDEDFKKVVKKYAKQLDNMIDNTRDFLLPGLYSAKALDKFSLKNDSDCDTEIPQYSFLRSAIAASMATTNNQDIDLVQVKVWYDLMSTLQLAPASPLLSNAGVLKGRYSTCFTQGEAQPLELATRISALAFGSHGVQVHAVPNPAASAKAIEDMLSVTPMETFRKPVTSYSLAIEHDGIMEFLEIKDPHLNPDTAGKTHSALWISDKFIEYTLAGNPWPVFSSEICKELINLYGDEYERRFEELVSQNKYTKKIEIVDIWNKIINIQRKSGEPSLLFKDHINKASNQDNIGPIKSSNLCVEITQYTDKETISVCNVMTLSAKSFVKYSTTGEIFFDFDALVYAAKETQKFADATTADASILPAGISKKSVETRSLGIGFTGLMDVLYMLNISPESKEGLDLLRKIQEHLYFGLLRSSVDMARDKGKYSLCPGSPFARGDFQFDLWSKNGVFNKNMLTISTEVWNKLKDDAKKYGLRNSHLTALQPGVMWAKIAGNIQSIELPKAHAMKDSDQVGDFLYVNSYLIKELQSLNLWNKKIADELMIKGSVRKINFSYYFPAIIDNPEILAKIDDIKLRFPTATEITHDTRAAIFQSIGPYVDQSISANLHVEAPNADEMVAYYIMQWALKAKTALYYVKMEPPRQASGTHDFISAQIDKMQEGANREESTEDTLTFDPKTQNPEANKYLKKYREMHWTPDEFDYKDITAFLDDKILSDGERQLIKNILAFFAVSDHLVAQNIGDNFGPETGVTCQVEAAVFAEQGVQEKVHEETYNNLLRMVCNGSTIEFDKLINQCKNPKSTIKAKIDFMKKYMDPNTASLMERLVAFSCVEGIMFSSSFAYLMKLKESHGKYFPSITGSNDLISRDEAMHTEFALHLIKKFQIDTNEQLKKALKKIISDASEIELAFAREVTCDGAYNLKGLSLQSMEKFIKFTTNKHMKKMGFTEQELLYPEIGNQNHISFMEKLGVRTKDDQMSRQSFIYYSDGVTINWTKVTELLTTYRLALENKGILGAEQIAVSGKYLENLDLTDKFFATLTNIELLGILTKKDEVKAAYPQMDFFKFFKRLPKRSLDFILSSDYRFYCALQLCDPSKDEFVKFIARYMFHQCNTLVASYDTTPIFRLSGRKRGNASSSCCVPYKRNISSKL